MKRFAIVLISCGFLILSFFIGAVIFKNQQAEKFGFMAQENASLFVRDYSPALGSDKARVYLVEFSDPACETCSAFHPFVKKLMAEHQGKIKLVLRYAPFHEGSEYFVKILEAAKKQGKFWETLEVMYGSQRYWASHHNPKPHLIWRFLPRAGLNIEKVKKDMNDPEIEKIIKQDLADVRTLHVRKTPGFFVNGKPLQSFGYAQLRSLVESEIEALY